MSSNPAQVELGVHSTSVLSRTWIKNITYICYNEVAFIKKFFYVQLYHFYKLFSTLKISDIKTYFTISVVFIIKVLYCNILFLCNEMPRFYII